MPGLIVTNPPYGERIGAESGLPALYSELGARAARSIPGLAGGDSHRQSAAGAQPRDLRQAHASGLQRHHRVPAAALRFERGQRAAAGRGGARGLVEPARRADVRQSAAQESAAPGSLGRTRAHRLLSRVRRRHAGIRVRHRSLRPRAAARLCAGICSAENRESGERPGAPPRGVGGAAGGAGGADCLRCTRGCASRRRAASSTRSATRTAERHAVQEGGLKFWVNFRDYLDTGLFLDHRIVRGNAARAGPRTRIS